MPSQTSEFVVYYVVFAEVGGYPMVAPTRNPRDNPSFMGGILSIKPSNRREAFEALKTTKKVKP